MIPLVHFGLLWFTLVCFGVLWFTLVYFTIVKETISLQEQKQFIVSNFKSKKIISLASLIKKLESKLEIIVTFLAVLDMIKESELICKQKNTFEDIEIKLNIITA